MISPKNKLNFINFKNFILPIRKFYYLDVENYQIH